MFPQRLPMIQVREYVREWTWTRAQQPWIMVHKYVIHFPVTFLLFIVSHGTFFGIFWHCRMKVDHMCINVDSKNWKDDFRGKSHRNSLLCLYDHYLFFFSWSRINVNSYNLSTNLFLLFSFILNVLGTILLKVNVLTL